MRAECEKAPKNKNPSRGTRARMKIEVNPQIPSLTANLSPPPPPPSNQQCLATVRHTDLPPFSMQVSHAHTYTH